MTVERNPPPADARQDGFSADVLRALTKWPDVPACYGWLALDRRGRWLVDGGPITHRRAVTFLNQHYTRNAQGAWFVQNGPQAAYVDLDLAPWIVQVGTDGQLTTHTGRLLGGYGAILVTESGEVLVETALGLASVDDRDITQLAQHLRPPDAPEEDALAALARAVDGQDAELQGHDGTRHVVRATKAAALASRYAFIRRPGPG